MNSQDALKPDRVNVLMTEGEAKTIPLGRKKILMVDPDLASYRLTAYQLAMYEIEPIHSVCGREAIRLFREDPAIDIIITELEVPGLDGFGILRKAREIRPGIPVIAQTAYVYEEIRRRCRDSGFNEYIPKPVDPELFAGTIKKYILPFAGKNT